jgi:hypothetical protein
LDRNSASPAASDFLGGILFNGRNSIGSSFTYSAIDSQIANATSGAEDSKIRLITTVAGTGKETIIFGTNTSVITSGVPGRGTSTLALKPFSLGQGERTSLSFWSTFEATPGANDARRTADIIAGFNGGNWGNEYLAFGVGNNSSSNDFADPTAEKMRITSTGRVGIGTIIPEFDLDVVTPAGTNSTIRARTLDVAGGSVIGRIIASHTSGAALEMRAGNGFTSIVADGTVPMIFNVGGSNRMRITTDGKVGIETSSPSANLHVVGTGLFSGLTKFQNDIELTEGNDQYLYYANTFHLTKTGTGDVFFVTNDASREIELARTFGQPLIRLSTQQAAGDANIPRLVFQRRGPSNNTTPDTVGVGEIRFDGITTTSGYVAFGLITVSTGLNNAAGAAAAMDFATSDGAGGVPITLRLAGDGKIVFPRNSLFLYQAAPTVKSAGATLTAEEFATGILNYTGSAATVNIPSGANIETLTSWINNNVSFDWYVINTGSGSCTIGANGSNTVGSLVVSSATSAHFRARRTATNTFTLYRMV